MDFKLPDWKQLNMDLGTNAYNSQKELASAHHKYAPKDFSLPDWSSYAGAVEYDSAGVWGGKKRGSMKKTLILKSQFVIKWKKSLSLFLSCFCLRKLFSLQLMFVDLSLMFVDILRIIQV